MFAYLPACRRRLLGYSLTCVFKSDNQGASLAIASAAAANAAAVIGNSDTLRQSNQICRLAGVLTKQ